MKNLGVNGQAVIDLRLAGLKNGEIAKRLGCSRSTVRYHLWQDAVKDDPDAVGPGIRGPWKRKGPSAAVVERRKVILGLARQGYGCRRIHRETGIPKNSVVEHLAVLRRDGLLDPEKAPSGAPAKQDPSPEEIRRLCLEFQKEWSPKERAKRAGFDVDGVAPELFDGLKEDESPFGWMPPVVRLAEVA